jgi:hypothetical protein
VRASYKSYLPCWKSGSGGSGCGIGGGGGGGGGLGVSFGVVFSALIKGETMSNFPSGQQTDNTDLIYQYIEKRSDSCRESYDELTKKLTSALAFSGVLLKFVADISEGQYQFIFQISICTALLASIGCCIRGLLAIAAGAVVPARSLLENPYYSEMPEQELKMEIAKQWVENIDALTKVVGEKSSWLNNAIYCFTTAAAIFSAYIVLP